VYLLSFCSCGQIFIIRANVCFISVLFFVYAKDWYIYIFNFRFGTNTLAYHQLHINIYCAAYLLRYNESQPPKSDDIYLQNFTNKFAAERDT
jgi:hypothetical protein